MSLKALLIIGICMEACYLAFYLFPPGPDQVLVLIGVGTAAFVLQTLLLWRIWRRSESIPHGKKLVIIVVGFGVLFRLTVVPHPVVGSDDIYRYLWDGRVASAGINPYRFLPGDSQLAHLATAELPAKVNHPELRSIYPPLAQLFFLISSKIFGESAAGMKLLLVLLDCGSIGLLSLLLRRAGRPPAALLLYAWSPLPVLYFGLDGHIDALGIPFLLLFILFVTDKRPWLASIGLGLAGLAKLVPLIVAPMFLRAGRGVRQLLLVALPFIVLALGYLIFYEPTGGMLESLNTFGSRWEFNGGIFTVAYYLSGPDNAVAHRICGILIACWIGILMLVKRPLVEKIFWCFAGFILLSPVVHPWYLTWLAALLVLRWSAAIYSFLALSILANVVVYQYQAFGEWNDQPVLLLLEYLPVAILLAREIARSGLLQKSNAAATTFLQDNNPKELP